MRSSLDLLKDQIFYRSGHRPSIAIYAIHGALVKKPTEIATKIKISDLKEGIYILTLETNDGEKFSRNFVKTN